MKITSILSTMIGELKQPAITGYQIGLFIYHLYTQKKYKNYYITNIKKNTPNRDDYNRYIKDLTNYGILIRNIVSHKEVFGVLSQSAPSAEEIICSIDPFVYISHLSAMEYHGLTDRFPKTLFLTTPKSSEWKVLAENKMSKDLGSEYNNYLNTGLPKLKKLKIEKIQKKSINSFKTTFYNPGSYIKIKDQYLRVSNIGRTFLDMLKHPNLCGGIYHVLDIYTEHAKRYLRLIVDEVDQHGSIIDKIRIGYILDERLDLKDDKIEKWKLNAQRGGSRKLVADEPYKPFFSENWCLSINIEENME